MWGVREKPSLLGRDALSKTCGAAKVGLVVLAFCGAMLPSLVQAQREAPQEAIALYRSGREHYDAGRYRDAIIDLKAALALDPESPNLLYNVARVSELLGNLDEAIAYYTRYIGMLTDADNDERERIRATIKRLEGARAELASSASARPETLREVIYREPPPSGTADTLFWVVGGSGVVLLGGTLATGLMALSRERKVNAFVIGEDGSNAERESLISSANGYALVSDLMLFTGIGAIGTAAALYFLRTPEAPPERRVQVSMMRVGDGGLLSIGGTF